MNLIRPEFRGTVFSIAGASDLAMKELITSRTINLYFIQRENFETAVTPNDFIGREGWWCGFGLNPINLGSFLFSLDTLCEAHDCLSKFFSDSINLKSNLFLVLLSFYPYFFIFIKYKWKL